MWDINRVAGEFPFYHQQMSHETLSIPLLCSVASFPQLSVLFLLTNRTNEQTVALTPHSPSSIYHLLSIASFYLLVFSSLHLNPPFLSLQSFYLRTSFQVVLWLPSRAEDGEEKWKNKRWKDGWGWRTTLKAAEGEIDFRQAMRNKCESSSVPLLAFSF